MSQTVQPSVLTSPASGRFGPWLWGAPVDIGVFVGSAAAALGLVVMARVLGLSPGPLPEWGWVVCVLMIDVAHVWSTLFRTYLDRQELRAHPWRYSLAPLGTYVVSVALYMHGARSFWRVLAYLAVYHFIRQQVGWVALYRSRAGSPSRVDKWIDDAVIYAATGYPIVHWHGRLAETKFNWFVSGDFVDVAGHAARVTPAAKWVWLACLTVFAGRQAQLWMRTGVLQLGKVAVVATTAAIWYVGIVATNSDFDFTVTNVIVHGVPYFALLYFYGRALRTTRPRALGAQVMAGGLAAFLGLLLVLAFVEEMAWNRLVYNDHDWLFGAGSGAVSAGALVFIVPLLSLPQATHYVLDGMLWRRRDTRSNAAQRAAVGFGG